MGRLHSMAVAHAAVLAQGQAFARQLQLFLALVFALAGFQALGSLAVCTGHGLVAFYVFTRVGVDHRRVHRGPGARLAGQRRGHEAVHCRLGRYASGSAQQKAEGSGPGRKTVLHGASFKKGGQKPAVPAMKAKIQTDAVEALLHGTHRPCSCTHCTLWTVCNGAVAVCCRAVASACTESRTAGAALSTG